MFIDFMFSGIRCTWKIFFFIFIEKKTNICQVLFSMRDFFFFFFFLFLNGYAFLSFICFRVSFVCLPEMCFQQFLFYFLKLFLESFCDKLWSTSPSGISGLLLIFNLNKNFKCFLGDFFHWQNFLTSVNHSKNINFSGAQGTTLCAIQF